MTFLAVTTLTACGASSSATKTAAPMMNLTAEMPTLTGANVWTFNKADSELTFTATHNNREFTGNFGHFSAVIKLDPARPIGGEIHAVIDVSSADAGDRDRNANLPTKDWFHAANFPTATFTSKDITSLSGDNFQAKGELRLKGITKPVTLAFSLQVDGDSAVAIGGADLTRTDFNVGEGPDFQGEDWVKFPVKVKFVVKANK